MVVEPLGSCYDLHTTYNCSCKKRTDLTQTSRRGAGRSSLAGPTPSGDHRLITHGIDQPFPPTRGSAACCDHTGHGVRSLTATKEDKEDNDDGPIV